MAYHPTYITQRFPQRFGSQQDDYLLRANQAIEKATAKIVAAKKEGRDLKKLFFEVIADLSLERAQIASDHRTDQSQFFGRRRDKDIGRFSCSTYLYDFYEEYNQKTLAFLYPLLKSMEVSPGIFNKSLKIEEKCLNRQFSFHIEVLQIEDLENRGWLQPSPLPDYIPAALQKNEKELTTPEECDQLRKAFTRFKAEQPEKYQQRKIQIALSHFQTKFPPATVCFFNATLYVRALLRCEIHGKLYALTQYFTQINYDEEWVLANDSAHHPLEDMKHRSKVMLLHQDELLIDETLDDIATIFERALQWNRKATLQDLKEQMTLFLYLSPQNMRDFRGTAAETEWMECAMYRALEVEVQRTDQLVDLEAFANPLFSKFRDVYDKMVTLK